MFSAYSCPKFQCLYILKNLCVDCFRYKLSVWSYIFRLNGPDKKPKQNSSKKKNDVHSNKTPRVFAEEQPSANKTFFGAFSQGLCADWLVYIAYCIFWHLIGSDQLSYFFIICIKRKALSETIQINP